MSLDPPDMDTPPPVGEADYGIADEATPPAFTDEALALRFSDMHRADLRFVAKWGRWMIRRPAVWIPDDTLAAFNMARAICREASAEANKERIAAMVASAKTVAAVEKLAKADRLHAATVDQWDADPWLLNTPGGVVDLRTRIMRRHRPDDYLTKITAVTPGRECPLWLAFLDRVSGGDADLISYLQRVCGYALTGVTREHAMWFAYGTGRNGKGVFLNTVTAIMGDYALTADPDTFTASGMGKHLTVLARLQGARLVVAQETEQGVPWAEARIKQITGGDPITANYMRQDPFTFVPQFKLFMAGNHKPSLKAVDEAIKARFNLVPFEVTIPKAERDPELPEKLKGEWSGILRWMIDGCMAWQKDGLAPPAIVQAATEDYLAAEDAFAIWNAECCKPIAYGWTEVKELFADWSNWAKASGEHPGTLKGFRQELTKRGYKPKQDPTTRRSCFEGIALNNARPANTEPAHERA